MATAVGDLAVRVGADTVGLESGMARGARSVKSFSETAGTQLRSAANNFAKMGAAAVTAGAAMTAAIYAKQSKVIDSLAKTADALNITTEGLQALNHMAELNGVSSESMAKGLRRMEVNLGMAARSGGAAAKALADINVDINDLIKQSPEKQISALSDAIAGIENQSLKASIATDLFGRDGLAMLKVLKQIDKDGLEPTIKKLDSFGVAISRVDAAKVEAANDAFFEAQQVVTGLANTLTVALSPFVQEAAQRFTEAATAGGGFGDTVVSAVQKSLKVFGFFGDAIRGIHVIIKGIELAFRGVGFAVATVILQASKDIDRFINDTKAALNVLIEGMNKLPKVDISTLFIGQSAVTGFLVDVQQSTYDAMIKAKDEMHALMMEPMPSSSIDNYLEAVKEKAQAAAVEVAEVQRQAMLPPVDEGGSAIQLPEADAEQMEALIAVHQGYYQSKEDAYAEHMNKMYGITRDSYAGMEGLVESHWGKAGAETAGAMKSILGTMAVSSKKAFQISKAWALADAIISTFQGIAAGVRLGWPMAIPAVAWAAATGFAQVSAISNQQFGGSGGAAAAGRGAPATAPNPVGVGGSTGGSGGASRSSTLTVAPIDPNAIFSGASMQAFGERIHEFSKDGGKVIFEA